MVMRIGVPEKQPMAGSNDCPRVPNELVEDLPIEWQHCWQGKSDRESWPPYWSCNGNPKPRGWEKDQDGGRLQRRPSELMLDRFDPEGQNFRKARREIWEPGDLLVGDYPECQLLMVRLAFPESGTGTLYCHFGAPDQSGRDSQIQQ